MLGQGEPAAKAGIEAAAWLEKATAPLYESLHACIRVSTPVSGATNTTEPKIGHILLGPKEEGDTLSLIRQYIINAIGWGVGLYYPDPPDDPPKDADRDALQSCQNRVVAWLKRGSTGQPTAPDNNETEAKVQRERLPEADQTALILAALQAHHCPHGRIDNRKKSLTQEELVEHTGNKPGLSKPTICRWFKECYPGGWDCYVQHARFPAKLQEDFEQLGRKVNKSD